MYSSADTSRRRAAVVDGGSRSAVAADTALYSFLDGVLSRSECMRLCKWTDGYINSNHVLEEESFTKVHLMRLPEAARKLVEKLIVSRVLTRLQQRPTERSLRFTFSAGEPAINRYAVPRGHSRSGSLRPHTDDMQLTVLVPLDNAYDGGGTLFWPRGTPKHGAHESSATVVRPPPGTAVIYGGDVLHTGRPVTRGVRHVLVASFSWRDAEADPTVDGGGATRTTWRCFWPQRVQRARDTAASAFWQASERAAAVPWAPTRRLRDAPRSASWRERVRRLVQSSIGMSRAS